MRPPIFCAGVSSVELGADCEVAVADVSFMAMAGAPGASRALSTTIGRLIEPLGDPGARVFEVFLKVSQSLSRLLLGR